MPRDPGASRHRRANPLLHPETAVTPASAFSVGNEVDERVREAILALPDSAWKQAIDAEGKAREGAQVTELTDRLDLSAWPEGTRLIVRHERPHLRCPVSGLRRPRLPPYRLHHDQDDTDIAALELRHRRHTRVEDSIRTSKETGVRGKPFGAFEHNQAWLEVWLLAKPSCAGAPCST